VGSKVKVEINTRWQSSCLLIYYIYLLHWWNFWTNSKRWIRWWILRVFLLPWNCFL